MAQVILFQAKPSQPLQTLQIPPPDEPEVIFLDPPVTAAMGKVAGGRPSESPLAPARLNIVEANLRECQRKLEEVHRLLGNNGDGFTAEYKAQQSYCEQTTSEVWEK